MGDDVDAPPAVERQRRALLVVSLVLVALLLGIWTQRRPIANHFVRQELSARNVRATYDLARIDVGTQRVENLVLGDPARPDLVAKWAEIDLAYGAFWPRVTAIRAGGVRLSGSLDEHGLHLGEVDKFRDPRSDVPFALPDIDLTVEDGSIALRTTAGPVGLSISGSGHLRSGFSGHLAAVTRDAALAGCSMPSARARLAVEIENGSPSIAGPVAISSVACPARNVGAVGLTVDAEATFADTLDRWTARLRGAGQAARSGAITLAQPNVDLQLSGNAREISGRGGIRMAAADIAGRRTGPGELGGRFALRDNAIDADGTVRATHLRILDTGSLAALARSTAATPVGPLAARLSRGLASLQRDNALEARFSFRQSGGDSRVRVASAALSGGRGERIALTDGGAFTLALPSGQWRLEGGATSGGGDLPVMALALDPAAGGAVTGRLTIEPYATGDARLAAQPLRFAVRPGGATTIRTAVTLDGPLPDGRVDGLSFPLAARWDGRTLIVNPGCAPARFAALRTGSLTLDGTRLQLCPAEGSALFARRGDRMIGGAKLASPVVTGRLGSSPMRLAAASASYRLDGGFDMTSAELRLGATTTPVILGAARLAGGAAPGGGIGGRASGVTSRIGAVPLLVRDGEARWSFAGSRLALDGRILVYDDANPDRVDPMASDDFRLTLGDGLIEAAGSLHLPRNERTVARVSVRHQLASGRGTALLSVRDLRFDRSLQPDELTPLALGVVANVAGSVNGSGRIDWSPQGVTSTGEFATENMSLAAAFGPVEGLSTRIRFTDLIGLVTAPDQVLTLRSANPGIEVRDGVIRYALLPGQRIAIAGGHWPFAGGDLNLLPTTLDMGSERARNLSFRVVGLDAGAFIQLLELENISATGTFDGLLPMVFDADGGRVVGGLLVARQGGLPPRIIDKVAGLQIPCDPARTGGTLAYVGAVSNENLGTFGKLAFDALKDLQYRCLSILMDGAIDGEIVTQVVFNGVNRGELSSMPQTVAKQFTGLPFLFNIKIQAPFRGLLNTARSFIDPSLIIRQQLGEQIVPVQNGLAVQPRESDNMPSGDRK